MNAIFSSIRHKLRRKLKILQITSARYMGGGERHVVDLCNSLSDRGCELFAAVAEGSAIARDLSFLPPANVIELPFRGTVDFAAARSIARIVRENDIDIVHAHVARDYLPTASAAKSAVIPFVLTRHVLFPMSKLHRVFLRKVSYVIAPSAAVADSLLAARIFPPEKIVTIRHGLREREPIAKQAKPGQPVIGSVGNLDPVKGFDLLIRAAQIVSDEMPGARFEIAGTDRESDSRNKAELTDLIARLGLEEKVTLTGWSDDVQKTIESYDLFVSSSRSESFGYAIAEAMLSGIPVVATETEGAREVLGDTGRLVPTESHESLASAILDVLKDPEQAQRSARLAHERVRREFSLSRMANETEALYKAAIAAARPPGA